MSSSPPVEPTVEVRFRIWGTRFGVQGLGLRGTRFRVLGVRLRGEIFRF